MRHACCDECSVWEWGVWLKRAQFQQYEPQRSQEDRIAVCPNLAREGEIYTACSTRCTHSSEADVRGLLERGWLTFNVCMTWQQHRVLLWSMGRLYRGVSGVPYEVWAASGRPAYARRAHGSQQRPAALAPLPQRSGVVGMPAVGYEKELWSLARQRRGEWWRPQQRVCPACEWPGGALLACNPSGLLCARGWRSALSSR